MWLKDMAQPTASSQFSALYSLFVSTVGHWYSSNCHT